MQKIIDSIAKCLTMCDCACDRLRRQNFHAGLGYISDMTTQLMSIFNLIDNQKQQLEENGIIVEQDNIMYIAQSLVETQEHEDYVMLSDVVELQVKPFLYQIQEMLLAVYGEFIHKNEKLYQNNLNGLFNVNPELVELIKSTLVTDDYVVEPTSSGYKTLCVQEAKGAFYFHSNVNPVTEAGIFANQYYAKEYDHYVVFGLGLGYHIQAICDLDNGVSIDIIEPDIHIIKSACLEMDLEWMYSNPRIHLYYDNKYEKLGELLGDNTALVVHYPSMRHISDEKIRLQVEKYFISDSGKKNFGILFENNYRDNLKNCDGYVDELESMFRGKDAIIVAAGPSLDKNVELLKFRSENNVIVAVGTVFRKLLEMDIKPDCVVFLDAQPRLYHQIEGLEQQNIPIICGATACKSIAEHYSGKKYLACQKGYSNAENFAKENGYRTYETGGSVSTIALDICIQLGCRSIAYIGLDLAYTNGYSHASDVVDRVVVNQDDLVIIDSYDGEEIEASRVYIMYREWIERRVARLKGTIPVYDATEGGAYKKGLIQVKLEQLMKTDDASKLKKVLVIIGQSQYQVLRRATYLMRDGFQRRGYAVEMLDLLKCKKITELFDRPIDEYDFLFSMQAVLFDCENEMGVPLVSLINRPWFGMIADDILYHFNRVKNCHFENAYIMGVDNRMKDYISAMFSGSTHAATLYHGGFECIETNASKDIDIFISGSFSMTMKRWDADNAMPIETFLVNEGIKVLMSNPKIAVRTALKQIFENMGEELTGELMHELPNVISYLDAHFRFLCRKNIIESLLNAGLKIHVAGNGYEPLEERYPDLVYNHGSLGIDEVSSLMARSKIVMNPFPPIFEQGYHERIFSSMLCKSICFTPDFDFVRENLGDRLEYIDLNNLSQMISDIKRVLENYAQQQERLDDNYQYALANHTWEKRGEDLVDFYESLS